MTKMSEDYIDLYNVNQYLDNLNEIKRSIDKITTNISLCRYDHSALKRVAESITEEDVAVSKYFKDRIKYTEVSVKDKWYKGDNKV